MKTIIFKRGLLLFNIILFLSFTKSIAQTSTIIGTVYEKEQSKTTFTTPNGTINVYLPDDLRHGDTITGTVTIHPEGSNDKKKNKNLEKLLKYELYLPNGEQIKSSIVQADGQIDYKTLSFQVPTEQPFAFELKNHKNKTISTIEIATLPDIPIIETATGESRKYIVQKTVISNTEPLVLSRYDKNTEVPQITLDRHNQNESIPITIESSIHSPRKLIYNLPQGLSGIYKLSVKSSEGKQHIIDLVNIVNVEASIRKGNLAKGEKTALNIRVSGLENCPHRPVQIELVNKTPSIIELENGNEQLFSVDQSDNPEALLNNTPFETTQNLTGETTGNFVINSTLRIPQSAYSNTSQAYFDNSENVDQFNESITALNSDIDSYLENDALESDTNAYLNSVKNSLPLANNENDLKMAKSQVVNLLNPILVLPSRKDFFDQMTNLENLHPELVAQTNTPQPIHPFHNLAGTFNSETNTLYVNAADEDSLLNYINANEMPNGNYAISLNDGIKFRLYTDVILNIGDSDVVYNVAYNTSSESKSEETDTVNNDTETKDDSKSNKTNTSTDTDSDTTKDDNNESDETPTTVKEEKNNIEYPDNVTAFEDKEGRKYRFYKNAKCKLLYSLGNDGELGNCGPKTYRTRNEKTGKWNVHETGKYSRWAFQSKKKCVKGDEFCTEMEQISATEMIYEDKNCKRLIEVKTHNDFLCE